MAVAVYYQLFHASQLLGEGQIEAPFTVGRQTEVGEAEPVSVLTAPSPQFVQANAGLPRKLVIVPLSNRSVPRLSLRIEVDREGNIVAHNVHRAVELQLPSNEALLPNAQRMLGAAGTICFPDAYQLKLTRGQPEPGTVRTGPAAASSSPAGRPGLSSPSAASSAMPGGVSPAPAAADASPPKSPSAVSPRSAFPSPPLSDTSRWGAASNNHARPSTAPPRAPNPLTESGRRWIPQKAPASGLGGDQEPRSFLALDYVSDPSNIHATRLLSMLGEEEISGRQEIAIRLVRTALEAFKEPPGSKEFFAAAGKAAIQMIDLDRAAVLRKEDGQWVCRVLSFRPGLDESRAAAREFSHTLLAQMEAAGKTTVIDPQGQPESVWRSITEVDRAVASPIFDEHKRVVGALYGDRLIGESDNNLPIGELEAALLEVLASGISSSLAIKQEQRLRSSMSQFFSPVVLSQLKQDPTLLDGRESNVSVLFCDIRNFSSVSEKIGPTKSIEWINDVFTTLSECVLAHDGVLVDYIGDELMAMWGAPGEQSDHAERVCRAALDMLAQIGPIQDKWRNVISDPLGFGFGIGISSGPASVGNTGSKKKFKYGPIGNTVNLASRVQGVTKQIGVPAIISGETFKAAQHAGFQMRRLAKARVVGIHQPIDLHQLCEDTRQRDLCQRYEQALQAYENNDLKHAAGWLASLVQDYPDDRPTIILLSRTVELLTQPDREFDPVWSLTHK